MISIHITKSLQEVIKHASNNQSHVKLCNKVLKNRYSITLNVVIKVYVNKMLNSYYRKCIR